MKKFLRLIVTATLIFAVSAKPLSQKKDPRCGQLLALCLNEKEPESIGWKKLLGGLLLAGFSSYAGKQAEKVKTNRTKLLFSVSGSSAAEISNIFLGIESH
jgi:hypothetical protein